ncbi:T9SS type A sorting domain-containing protein [Croceimicrobium sp.]|uniref:T9SS type A sorting domain-containing protein n=1 Tax=Croceimicrobium sp. TaxID=2828340 RepID=UPI003BAB714C
MFRSYIGLILCSLALQAQAQTETIKVVSYNLMYYKTGSAPCNHSRTAAQRDADLQTIVSYLAPDVMVVNELGNNPVNPLVMLSDIFNVNGISYYDRAGSSNNSSSGLVNMLFYNKEKLVLASQSSINLDINQSPLVRVIDFYRLYVKDAGLGTAGVDTVFFTIGVAHLKAGNSSTDAAERARATAAVMDYIDQNIPDDNVLFAGDLNVYSANQAAFQNLINYTANPAISFNDPENQLGSWNNNSNFAAYHTQSTHASSSGCFSGGGMDDRFDFILISDAIENNSDGLDFIDYRAVGQDGSSCCGGSLSTNNNVSVNTTVASALYNFSDHLPVELELEATVSGIGLSPIEKARKAWTFSNPIENQLVINFSGLMAKKSVQVKVLSINGQMIGSWNSEAQARLSIDCSVWQNGIYLIQVSDGAEILETRKVIKR